MSSTSRPLRIAWLTTYDFDHEFRDVEAGRTPSHRLMGARELRDLGHRIRYLHRQHAGRLPAAIDWRSAQLRWLLTLQRDVDVVVATHEAAALPALLAKRLGLLRRPVLVMTVAATNANYRTSAIRQLQGWALGAAEMLTTFASSQIAPLRRLVGASPDIRFLPLGIDADYFSPVDAARENTIASVGTNEGKDFVTLVQALPNNVPCLIVTDEKNREEVHGHVRDTLVRFASHVPIAQLKAIYASCGRMVIPLREVAFSSGQTVLLENMAMETPLVISDVSGIRDYVDESVTLVPPGDVNAMRTALEHDTARPSRLHVTAHFTIARMAADLDTLLHEIMRAEGEPAR